MDSCQLGHKPINTLPQSPGKLRSVHIKKSHSTTPSPEMIASKMNVMATMCSPDICLPPNESHIAQHSPQANLSRSRLAHSNSPLDHRNENIKRRRLDSSPVRPWKSPSPPPPHSQPISTSTEVNPNSAPNLLRHISVIRETPPILKPQVMTPAPYHPHPYHHLVDQYAAAYHLYKTGPNGTTMAPQNNPSSAPHPTHHWGAYG